MIVAKDKIDSLLDCKFSTYNLKFGANSVIKAGKKKSIIPPIAIIPKQQTDITNKTAEIKSKINFKDELVTLSGKKQG